MGNQKKELAEEAGEFVTEAKVTEAHSILFLI